MTSQSLKCPELNLPGGSGLVVSPGHVQQHEQLKGTEYSHIDCRLFFAEFNP